MGRDCAVCHPDRLGCSTFGEGQTVGEPGRTGKYLGTADFLVADATRGALPELGGWKDAEQGHEPDTAAGNTNLLRGP